MSRKTEILSYIENYILKFGYFPGVDEIAEKLGISKPNVSSTLSRLRKSGDIDWAYSDVIKKESYVYLDAIEKYTLDKCVCPTIRDLQEIMGASSSSVVSYHLKKLRDAGYIHYSDNKARTVHIKDHDRSANHDTSG